MRFPALLALLLVAALGGCGVELELPADADGPLRGRVVRVIDGDTIKVRIGTRRETVRLIGIDTPETHRPGTPVECGGRAATRAMERLAMTPDGRGRSVTLRPDPTQDRRDRYGRLLAYADTAADVDLGEEIVRAGWADVYVFERPFLRLGRYRRAARAAEKAGRGVWRSCGGDFHRDAG